VPSTIPQLQISEFTEESVDYIAAFNSLATTINNIDAVIAALRLTYDSLQERADSYTKFSDLDGVVDSLISSPINPADISLSALSFSHVTTPSYLDKNLQTTVPTFSDIEYPTSSVKKYVFVENGSLQALPSLLLEKVLDTSKFVEQTGFLINNNGALEVAKTIPFSMVYSSPSSTGFPPGSVIMWNGDVASSPFMPYSSTWSYPAITSWTQSPLQLNSALSPRPIDLAAGASTRTIVLKRYGPPLETINQVLPNTVRTNLFGFNSGVYSTIYFSEAGGRTPAAYFGDYFNRSCCLLVPPFVRLQSFFDSPQHFSNGPSNGLLIEMGLYLTDTPILNSDGTTFTSSIFSIESYEGYGTSVFGITFTARNISGVYTYILSLNGSVFSAGYVSLDIPMTRHEIVMGWTDIVIICEDNKYKVFINNKEKLRGTGTPGSHRPDTTKSFYVQNRYSYIGEANSTLRWNAWVCVSFDKFIYGVKNVYKIDWNRTDNWLFKSNETYTAIAANREWTPFKGQYPALESLYGTMYNTAADNAAGNICRLPLDFKGMLLRGRDSGSGVNTNLSHRTLADNNFSRLDAYLLQSHVHEVALTKNIIKAGSTTIVRNHSTNVAGTQPVVNLTDAAINTAKNIILVDCSTAYRSVTKNMSVTYFLITGL